MNGSSNLVGKYCLCKNLSKIGEFRDEVYTITGVHNIYDNYVFLNGDLDSLRNIRGLLISDDIDYLNEILRVQKTYLNQLELLKGKMSKLNIEYNKNILDMLNE